MRAVDEFHLSQPERDAVELPTRDSADSNLDLRPPEIVGVKVDTVRKFQLLFNKH